VNADAKTGLTAAFRRETLSSADSDNEAAAMSKSLTRIIGLDPGLCNLGWGVVDWDEVRLAFVACGTISSETNSPIAGRLPTPFDGLNEVLHAWTPAEAAVEETFVNGNSRS